MKDLPKTLEEQLIDYATLLVGNEERGAGADVIQRNVTVTTALAAAVAAQAAAQQARILHGIYTQFVRLAAAQKGKAS